MEARMRLEKIPLYSLETKHPLAAFNIIGFSLPYETLYTNMLNLLDLAEIPLFSSERNQAQPLIIAGGHATYNPEPMHAFIDAFVIGEGEEVMMEIVNTYQAWKSRGESRPVLLHDLARLQGVYVPSLYQPDYLPDGTLAQVETLVDDAPMPVVKRIVGKLPPPPTHFIVPYIDVVHNRIPIEIMRGCTRGCRFCHAGIVTRPIRQRPVGEIITAISEATRHTGLDEIGLLSLSSSDYTHVLELVQAVRQHFGKKHLNISLPSLRIETLTVDLIEALQGAKRGGFTLAPEAATERMRNIINKPLSTDQLLKTAGEIYGRGWTTIKLYFMIGHPSETLQDVKAITDLCKKILAEGRQVIGGRAKVHAGVSTFVPKPHTPFQWTSCDTPEQIRLKQDILRHELRSRSFKLTWTDPRETLLEASLARGDRRLAEVIYEAWKNGAKFDSWHDQSNPHAWEKAFEKAGLTPDFYTHRPRSLDEVFPWDHISTGVRKQFLLEDYLWSQEGKTRLDCRQQCYACGILPYFTPLRKLNPGEAWLCPDVTPGD
ncbi:MAG: TIGR03960 family B12-binding radical SAM protein, partial [Anaerolineales bacterium]|nr:TIGR03960 family B12-binding radical SAM protein [Anaerolineales bacterium]